MSDSKSVRLVTTDGATDYSFSHSDANGFPRLLPPARKIGLGRRALAGMIPSEKGVDGANARFESALERDFFILLEFNLDVLRWDAQPLRLDLGEGLGTYVPDVLVTYLNASRVIDDTRRVLYEVKYRDELKRKWTASREKYRAASRYARLHGWRFEIVTEREIRTELLWNAKFLLPYLQDEPPDDERARLMSALAAAQETTPEALLSACSPDRLVQARLLTTLWHLVASRQVGTDLTRKLSMRTWIWPDA